MRLVSVVIPCFNLGEYIIESVISVKQQTYPNIEIIIVNDGSNEKNTKDLLQNFPIENIKILHLETNNGVCVARNIGINHSQGEYILTLDADDLLLPTYIEKCVAILDKNMNTGIVYSQANLFGLANGLWDLKKFSISDILVENLIFSAALFRKKDFLKTVGFNPIMKHGGDDWDFWLSIIELGNDVHRIDEVLFLYRIRKNSRSRMVDSLKLLEIKKQVKINHPKLYNNKHDA